jgi:hypothetical protein
MDRASAFPVALIKLRRRISASDASFTKFRYYESIVFSHSGIRCLRWKRSGWACAHRAIRGEEHCDYGEERRA